MNGISVILPTLNRTSFLSQTLECLVIQKFELPFEIIIVDQSTVPDKIIQEYCSDFKFIRYYHITRFRGLPEARNFGWQNATYDYILYLDDDITCGDNLLTEHYKFISKPEIGIVAGGITEGSIPKKQKKKPGKFNSWTAQPKKVFYYPAQQEVDHACGCNYSIKKKILEKIGGTDENLTKGAALHEETDLCLRTRKNKYKIFFNYNAHVVHHVAETGGCRVPDIQKYLYSLVRNRSLIIARHLRWYQKITAHLYLVKLVFAFMFTYKKPSLIKVYLAARNEGTKTGRLPVKTGDYRIGNLQDGKYH